MKDPFTTNKYSVVTGLIGLLQRLQYKSSTNKTSNFYQILLPEI